MARKPRQKSATGIYHVMLRGINKQNIFFCEDDFVKMLYILHDSQYVKDYLGKIISDDVCTIYAYCILDNHLHILLREGTDTISNIMKKIEDRYASYYNFKYDRVGHLFQGRFPSEPVNDEEYFHRLLRYIHRNSVKAMEARSPEEYPYSSWNEYTSNKSNVISVLKTDAIQAVYNRYSQDDLIKWVNMDVDDKCLDMDSFKNIISDYDAKEILTSITGYKNMEDFKLLDFPTQTNYLIKAVSEGVSLRQASRLGTVTFYQLQKSYAKFTESLQSNSTVKAPEDIHELISKIEGLGKQTRHKIHQIADYLEMHPHAKRTDIATYLNINTESTRRLLVRMINNNIVIQEGSARSTSFSLKSV